VSFSYLQSPRTSNEEIHLHCRKRHQATQFIASHCKVVDKNFLKIRTEGTLNIGATGADVVAFTDVDRRGG
jgi:hypothetical protein